MLLKTPLGKWASEELMTKRREWHRVAEGAFFLKKKSVTTLSFLSFQENKPANKYTSETN